MWRRDQSAPSKGQSWTAGATAQPMCESAMPKYRNHRSSNSTSDWAKHTFATCPCYYNDATGWGTVDAAWFVPALSRSAG